MSEVGRTFRVIHDDTSHKRSVTPGMVRLRCQRLACGRYFYSYDSFARLCYTCCRDPKHRAAHESLFSQGRELVQKMTDEEFQRILKDVPF